MGLDSGFFNYCSPLMFPSSDQTCNFGPTLAEAACLVLAAYVQYALAWVHLLPCMALSCDGMSAGWRCLLFCSLCWLDRALLMSVVALFLRLAIHTSQEGVLDSVWLLTVVILPEV